MLDRLRYLCSRIGPWPRRLAALACLLLAATTALSAHGKGAGPASVSVAVAAHDLPAGHRLVSGDLALGRWPGRGAPTGAATSTRVLVGRRLAGPLARGEPVTGLRLVGRGLTTGLPAGTVAVSVDVDDRHVADLVHPGDRVDLLAAPATPDPADAGPVRPVPPATVLADDVRVLAVLASDDPAGGTGPGDATPEVVIAATRATAVRLAGQRGVGPFTVVALPP